MPDIPLWQQKNALSWRQIQLNRGALPNTFHLMKIKPQNEKLVESNNKNPAMRKIIGFCTGCGITILDGAPYTNFSSGAVECRSCWMTRHIDQLRRKMAFDMMDVVKAKSKDKELPKDHKQYIKHGIRPQKEEWERKEIIKHQNDITKVEPIEK